MVHDQKITKIQSFKHLWLRHLDFFGQNIDFPYIFLYFRPYCLWRHNLGWRHHRDPIFCMWSRLRTTYTHAKNQVSRWSGSRDRGGGLQQPPPGRNRDFSRPVGIGLKETPKSISVAFIHQTVGYPFSESCGSKYITVLFCLPGDFYDPNS